MINQRGGKPPRIKEACMAYLSYWSKNYTAPSHMSSGNGLNVAVGGRYAAVFKQIIKPEDEGIYGPKGFRIGEVAYMDCRRTKKEALCTYIVLLRKYLHGVEFRARKPDSDFAIPVTGVVSPNVTNEGRMPYAHYPEETIFLYGPDGKPFAKGEMDGYTWRKNPVVISLEGEEYLLEAADDRVDFILNLESFSSIQRNSSLRQDETLLSEKRKIIKPF